MRCSVVFKKVKPSFSNWISEGTTFLKRVLPCLTLLDESLLVFVYIFKLNQTFCQNFSWLGVKTTFAMCFCEGNSIPRANYISVAWRIFHFFSKSCFWECPKFDIVCLIEFALVKISFDANLRKEIYFKQCNFVRCVAGRTLNCFLICLIVLQYCTFLKVWEVFNLEGGLLSLQTTVSPEILKFICFFTTKNAAYCHCKRIKLTYQVFRVCRVWCYAIRKDSNQLK